MSLVRIEKDFVVKICLELRQIVLDKADVFLRRRRDIVIVSERRP